MQRKIKIMKKILIALCALGLMTACHKDDNEEEKAGRTVLIYMAAENNLGRNNNGERFAYDDILEIKKGVRTIGNNHLVVYVDKCNDPDPKFNDPTPYMLHFHEGELKDSIPLKETYTADAAVLEMVARQAFDSWPAKSYALCLWGHGTGWTINNDSLKYNARKKAYGGDTGNNSYSSAGRYWMNIPSMKLALSRLPHLDYILADCCNMMCLEVAYELKDVTDYLFGSPAEIPAEGAPYDKIVTEMFNTNIASVYKNIIDHYRDYKSVPLSCVKTSEMANVANATKAVLKNMKDKHGDSFVYPDMKDLIHYYYKYDTQQEYYDANDFVLKYADTDQYKTWKEALDKAVIYKRIATSWDTDKYWSSYYTDFKMTDAKFGGVSMFVPTYYQKTTENKTIEQMGWYYAAGYADIGWKE